MNKTQKTEAIKILQEQFSSYSHFYVTNTESLSVAQISTLRKTCFDKKVVLKVAKNTLIKKALTQIDSAKYEGVLNSLHGVTALMFSNNPKEPAVIMSSFRDANPKVGQKPALKLAYVGGEIFIGDEQLIQLKNLKTKDELIGEVIGLLQSPLRNILSGLTREDRNGKTAVAEDTATPAPVEVALTPTESAPETPETTQ